MVREAALKEKLEAEQRARAAKGGVSATGSEGGGVDKDSGMPTVALGTFKDAVALLGSVGLKEKYAQVSSAARRAPGYRAPGRRAPAARSRHGAELTAPRARRYSRKRRWTPTH